MPKLPNKYGDFSDLEGLIDLIERGQIVTGFGKYDDHQVDPGPHISLTGPDATVAYDFIKRPDGSYILRIRR